MVAVIQMSLPCINLGVNWFHCFRQDVICISFFPLKQVHTLAISMLEKGVPMTTTGTILSLAKQVHTHTLSISGLLKEVLQKNLDSLRYMDEC